MLLADILQLFNCCWVARLYLTLCSPMDCSMPASLSLTISQSLLKVMSIELLLPPHPLFPSILLSSVFCSIRIFSDESALHIRWPNIGAITGAAFHSSSVFLHSAMTLAIFVMCVLVPQACPTLWNPGDYSPPGSSVLGIPQARMLEWVAIYFSRASSWPRDRTQVFIAGRFFTVWATRGWKTFSHQVLFIFWSSVVIDSQVPEERAEGIVIVIYLEELLTSDSQGLCY